MQIDPKTDSLSYWHATAEPMIPEAELPSTAEAVVIGGGMLGVWTTYWLAKAGVDVVLLEKSAIGWGASGRNGGFLTGGGAIGYQRMIDTLGHEQAKSFFELSMEGQELPHQVVAEEGIDCDLRRNGTLGLALSEEELAAMTTEQELLARDGFTREILDRQQVQKLIATPLADEIIGASFARSGALLHSSRYLAGLARAARKHGARIVKGTVESIDARPDGATVRTSVGTIDTARVVTALNAWTDSVLPELKGAIVPTRGQILAYKPSKRVFTTAIGADTTPTGDYWQQTPDGTIIIGGARGDAPNGDSDIREMIFTQEISARIEQLLPRLFPELTSLEVDRRWAGLMAFTADGLPIVDHIESSDAVWFGGGFNGHGMPFGPVLGKLLANSIVENETASELAMLSRNRTSLKR